MSFARANPAGWAFGETLTSTQMNTSDAYWPDAVDAGSGGTYTPTAQIDFQGTGGGSGSAVNFQYPPTLDSTTVTLRQPLAFTPGYNTTTDEADWSQVKADGATVTFNAEEDGLGSYYHHFSICNIPGDGTLTEIRAGLKLSTTAGPVNVVKLRLHTLKNDAAGDSDGQEVTAADLATFQVVTLPLTTPAATSGASANTSIVAEIDTEFFAGFQNGSTVLYYIEADFTVTKLLNV